MVVDKIANRIRWGYLTAFILLLSSYILTFYTTKRLLHQGDLVSNTNSIINQLQNILADIKDAETGIRGYYLINDERFLEPYKDSHERAERNFNKLRGLLKDEHGSRARLDTLQILMERKYHLIETGLSLYISNAKALTDTQKILIQQGKTVMDRIRNEVKTIESGERRRMEMEQEQMNAFFLSIKAINIASLVVAVLLAFYSIITFNKENNGRKDADSNAAVFREQLEVRVEELDKLNKELVELRSQEKFAVTGRISRTIAHEVRNPLTNINLATEHLKGEIVSNAETDILFEMISRNANRINVLISDLLNSTKAAHLNFERSSINALLDETLELAQDRIKLNSIKVIKRYDPEICDAMVDPDKLKIAFLNIIVNAIEAMDPDTGVLQMVTESKDGKCVVKISDNGKGMDQDSVSKLFEPYFTTKENGNGLGLTNTHNIILNHKASIYATSEIGKGTILTITLNCD